MDPRGISHAASGAKVPFPTSILDAGNPSAPDQSRQFAMELDREIQRQQRSPENSKPDGMQFREEERTKESNLDKTKGPQSAWENESRKPIDREGEINTGPQIRENKAPRKTTLYDDTKQAELVNDLPPALEEWVVNFLKAMLTRRVDSPGPGGRIGPDEGELGPRFAIPAPTAINSLRGNSGVLQNQEAVRAEVPPTEGSASVTNITPNQSGEGGKAANPNTSDIDRRIVDLDALLLELNGQPGSQNPEAASAGRPGTIPQPLNTGTNASSAAKGNVESVFLAENKQTPNSEAASAEGQGLESSIKVNVITNGEAIRHLAELIGKAVEAANNAFKDIAQKGLEGLTGDKEFILRAIMDDGLGAFESKEILKQMKPADNPAPVDKGPSVMNPTLEGMQNILGKYDQSDLRDLSNPQPFKPDDASIAAEVERITRDFTQEMVTSVKLRLHPPELGNLVVEFKRDEHGLRIEFHTQNQAVLKALEEAGPKMMERLEKAGVDVGSLDVFLHNNGGMGHSIVSPLDNPNNSPDSTEFDGDIVAGGEHDDTVSMRYLAYDSSIIDLVV